MSYLAFPATAEYFRRLNLSVYMYRFNCLELKGDTSTSYDRCSEVLDTGIFQLTYCSLGQMR